MELIAKLTGLKAEFLREYVNVVRTKSLWTARDLLNNNTDGPGNPLSQVFSRREARQMFRQFSSSQTRVYWLVKKNIPLIGKLIPRPVDHALGRILGWDLYTFAVK